MCVSQQIDLQAGFPKQLSSGQIHQRVSDMRSALVNPKNSAAFGRQVVALQGILPVQPQMHFTTKTTASDSLDVSKR